MGTEIEIFNATSMAAAGGRWGAMSAKRCDSCKTAAATAFCRADSAFLCLPCDGRIHCGSRNGTNNKLVARHERVLMCEVCEQAPAAVTCKADAAALCVTCDSDIHSVNPVARRHERVPIEPFVDSVPGDVGNRAYSSGFSTMVPTGNEGGNGGGGGGCDYDHEADGVSWMLPGGIVGGGGLIPQLNQKLGEQGKSAGDPFFGEMDEILEFGYGNPLEGRFQQSYSCASDGVVPVQSKPLPLPLPLQLPATTMGHQISLTGPENDLDFGFCRPKVSSFSYPTQSSLSNSVSSSSHDAGIVPDWSSNSMSEISFSFDHPNVPVSTAPTTANPIHHHHQAPAQPLCRADREARVMRYREKRKNRKFEKTIRYASRKAYAEARPRIKGRFAKRSENSNMEPDFGSSLYGSAVTAASLSFVGNFDSRFDLVPSFR
ncbi:unnamed protein product [Linum tenue]|uniref:Uncharacterized protein n=1 Tax=Linum tenue TaxID=586396 RepID=A0AAV0KBS5_9ROSI|nr:unnamed protein product [Linum tenue]